MSAIPDHSTRSIGGQRVTPVSWPALVRLELLVLWRSRGIGLYAVVMAGVIVALQVFGAREATTHILTVTATAFLGMGLPVLALALGPALVWSWTRRGDVLWASGVHLVLLATARLTAALLAVCGILLVAGATAGLLLGVYSVQPPLATGVFLGTVLIRLLLPVACSQVALVHALAHVLPRTTWVAVPCLVLTFLTLLAPYLFVQHLLAPLNYSWVTLSFDPVLGMGADSRLQGDLAWVYLGGGIALWLLSLPVATHRDERVDSPPGQCRVLATGTAVGLGLITAVVAGYLHLQHSSVVPPPAATPPGEWTVLTATHKVQLTDTELAAVTRLQLQPSSGKPVPPGIELALNPGLQVQAATLADQPVQAMRHGEAVVLPWPSEIRDTPVPIEVEIRYAGQPRLLREDYGQVSFLPYMPPSFRRPAVSYMGRDALFWVRDHDWLAWPYTAQAQQAWEASTLAITVTRADADALVSTAD